MQARTSIRHFSKYSNIQQKIHINVFQQNERLCSESIGMTRKVYAHESFSDSRSDLVDLVDIGFQRKVYPLPGNLQRQDYISKWNLFGL